VKKSQKQALAVGAGVAALAAAAASYFLAGKRGARNRKKVGVWAAKMQKEVVSRIKEAREMSQSKYHEIIDKVHENYKSMKNVDPKELAATASEMKKHWSKIQAEFKKATSDAKKIPGAAKRAVKSARRGARR
jgi:gas vesicle protein